MVVHGGVKLFHESLSHVHWHSAIVVQQVLEDSAVFDDGLNFRIVGKVELQCLWYVDIR